MGKNRAREHKTQEASVNEALTNHTQKAAEFFLLAENRFLESTGDSYELTHKA